MVMCFVCFHPGLFSHCVNECLCLRKKKHFGEKKIKWEEYFDGRQEQSGRNRNEQR